MHVSAPKSPSDPLASDQQKSYHTKDDQCHHGAKGEGSPTDGESVLPSSSSIDAWCPRVKQIDSNHDQALLFNDMCTS